MAADTRIPLTAPICILSGPDEVQKEIVLERFLAQVAPKEARGFDVEFVDAREVSPSQVLPLLFQPPLTAKRRVVVVRNAEAWPGAEVQKLALALSKEEVRSTLILLCPEKKRLPKAGVKAVYDPDTDATVEHVGKIIELSPPKPAQAQMWVRRYARSLGKDLVPAAAAYLCQMVGTDLGRLKTEVEKLATYVGSRKKIAKADVEAVASRTPEESVFRLTEAISRKDASYALLVLEDLLNSGESEATLLSFIIRQMSLIAQAKFLVEQKGLPSDPTQIPENLQAQLPSRDNLASFLQRNPYWRNRYVAQAGKWSWEELERAFALLREADLALKQIKPAPKPPEVLKETVLRLCSL